MENYGIHQWFLNYPFNLCQIVCIRFQPQITENVIDQNYLINIIRGIKTLGTKIFYSLDKRANFYFILTILINKFKNNNFFGLKLLDRDRLF